VSNNSHEDPSQESNHGFKVNIEAYALRDGIVLPFNSIEDLLFVGMDDEYNLQQVEKLKRVNLTRTDSKSAQSVTIDQMELAEQIEHLFLLRRDHGIDHDTLVYTKLEDLAGEKGVSLNNAISASTVSLPEDPWYASISNAKQTYTLVKQIVESFDNLKKAQEEEDKKKKEEEKEQDEQKMQQKQPSPNPKVPVPSQPTPVPVPPKKPLPDEWWKLVGLVDIMDRDKVLELLGEDLVNSLIDLNADASTMGSYLNFVFQGYRDVQHYYPDAQKQVLNDLIKNEIDSMVRNWTSVSSLSSSFETIAKHYHGVIHESTRKHVSSNINEHCAELQTKFDKKLPSYVLEDKLQQDLKNKLLSLLGGTSKNLSDSQQLMASSAVFLKAFDERYPYKNKSKRTWQSFRDMLEQKDSTQEGSNYALISSIPYLMGKANEYYDTMVELCDVLKHYFAALSQKVPDKSWLASKKDAIQKSLASVYTEIMGFLKQDKVFITKETIKRLENTVFTASAAIRNSIDFVQEVEHYAQLFERVFSEAHRVIGQWEQADTAKNSTQELGKKIANLKKKCSLNDQYEPLQTAIPNIEDKDSIDSFLSNYEEFFTLTRQLLDSEGQRIASIQSKYPDIEPYDEQYHPRRIADKAAVVFTNDLFLFILYGIPTDDYANQKSILEKTWCDNPSSKEAIERCNKMVSTVNKLKEPFDKLWESLFSSFEAKRKAILDSHKKPLEKKSREIQKQYVQEMLQVYETGAYNYRVAQEAKSLYEDLCKKLFYMVWYNYYAFETHAQAPEFKDRAKSLALELVQKVQDKLINKKDDGSMTMFTSLKESVTDAMKQLYDQVMGRVLQQEKRYKNLLLKVLIKESDKTLIEPRVFLENIPHPSDKNNKWISSDNIQWLMNTKKALNLDSISSLMNNSKPKSIVTSMMIKGTNSKEPNLLRDDIILVQSEFGDDIVPQIQLKASKLILDSIGIASWNMESINQQIDDLRKKYKSILESLNSKKQPSTTKDTDYELIMDALKSITSQSIATLYQKATENESYIWGLISRMEVKRELVNKYPLLASTIASIDIRNDQNFAQAVQNLEDSQKPTSVKQEEEEEVLMDDTQVEEDEGVGLGGGDDEEQEEGYASPIEEQGTEPSAPPMTPLAEQEAKATESMAVLSNTSAPPSVPKKNPTLKQEAVPSAPVITKVANPMDHIVYPVKAKPNWNKWNTEHGGWISVSRKYIKGASNATDLEAHLKVYESLVERRTSMAREEKQ